MGPFWPYSHRHSCRLASRMGGTGSPWLVVPFVLLRHELTGASRAQASDLPVRARPSPKQECDS